MRKIILRMVEKMKKTIALLLAVLIAAVAVCTMSISAFAAPANDDPTDPLIETTAAPTTAAPTTAAPATTAAPTTAAPETTAAPTAASTAAPVVTNKEGVTAIDDGPADNSPSTRVASYVDDVNPSTGSSIVVPAIALLALAVGTVAVVKTKKED